MRGEAREVRGGRGWQGEVGEAGSEALHYHSHQGVTIIISFKKTSSRVSHR